MPLAKSMDKAKVHILGGDGVGWALDTDLRQLRTALEGLVQLTDLAASEVVHSVWWEPLLAIPESELVGKKVICQVSGEPLRYLELPAFRRVLSRVGCWIAQSSQAQNQLVSLGLPSVTVPYTTDIENFRPVGKDDPVLITLAETWNIPRHKFLIGNFHRDTEGNDLTSPKLVKGPDVFAEIMAELVQRRVPFHVVLAGPRRNWMRRRLTELGVPFTFVGKETDRDDMVSNLLAPQELNNLYNLLDLYLITSRSEGGPRSLLEAVAAGCRVISSRVGLAEDVLLDTALYATPLEACALVQHAWGARDAQACSYAQERLASRHTIAAATAHLSELYASVLDLPPFFASSRGQCGTEKAAKRGTIVRVARRLLRPSNRFTAGVWHQFFAPPYGGGNQFMLALCKCLHQSGVSVRENCFSSSIDAYLLNSVHFDVDAFLSFAETNPVRVVHRIDGPIHLIRGHDLEKDELCFELNRRFASATVIQSRWTLRQILAMGYRPVNPVIIHNGVDPAIFHRRGRKLFAPERSIRLISSSWSDNPRKGGAIYAWLDRHLDYSRFEYSFIGRCSEKLNNARTVTPLPSLELAQELRQHDIYITASSNDPCSNAVIEALACGLPVLYLNDGGHPELVGQGGLPFNSPEEIPAQLEKLVTNYTMFQNLITVPSMQEVAGKYLQLLKDAAEVL